VMELGGRKICGGAQRRTRRGFLHQGSLQSCAWPPDLAARLAALLSKKIEPFAPDETDFSRMTELAATKYGSFAWLRRLP
jgi:hypothetical protein